MTSPDSHPEGLIVARQEGKRAYLDGITGGAHVTQQAAWSSQRPVTYDDVIAAVRKIEAIPQPPKCVAMNPADIDALRGKPGTLGPDGYGGVDRVKSAALLGIPVFPDPDVPIGRPEFRDEYPEPQP